MSAEGTKPPPFYCPACGKKHRADLSALQEHEGAHAKVTCHRCGVDMSLSLGSDGLPKCEMPGSSEGAPAGETTAPATGPASTPAAAAAVSGGTMSKSTLPLHLLAAAVVAAVVSFVVVNVAKPDAGSGDGDATARIAALEKALSDTRAELGRRIDARAGSGGTGSTEHGKEIAALKEALARMEKSVSGNGAGVENLTQLFRNASASFAKLEKDYKALNGRIEANYQKGRELDKRVTAVESN
jgi:hypothetical protein